VSVCPGASRGNGATAAPYKWPDQRQRRRGTSTGGVTMTEAIRRINLQLFADDGSGAGGDSAPNDAGTPGGQQGGDGGGSQADKPFAVFPDEKSFMSRVDREARKRLDARAKELGFESI